MAIIAVAAMIECITGAAGIVITRRRRDADDGRPSILHWYTIAVVMFAVSSQACFLTDMAILICDDAVELIRFAAIMLSATGQFRDEPA